MLISTDYCGAEARQAVGLGGVGADVAPRCLPNVDLLTSEQALSLVRDLGFGDFSVLSINSFNSTY